MYSSEESIESSEVQRKGTRISQNITVYYHEKLGSGTFSTVYKGTCSVRKVDVAIKKLKKIALDSW